MDAYFHIPKTPDRKKIARSTAELARCPHYSGPLKDCAPDEVALMLSESIEYFALRRCGIPPMPFDGLYGVQKLPDHPHAANLWREVIWTLEAMASGMPRRMEKAWFDLGRYVDDAIEASKLAERADAHERSESARLKRERNMQVYFIAADDGPIKIGIACNPENRLKGLQTSHHTGLKILATRKGGLKDEKAYHRRFAHARLSGEWFRRCPEIEAEISRLSAPLPMEGV